MGRSTCVLFLAFAATSASAQVSDKVDRFTGERVLEYTQPGQSISGHPIVSLVGKSGPKGTLVAWKFFVIPELDERAQQHLKYLQCHTIDWLVDGKPIALGTTVHNFDRMQRVLFEVVVQEVPIEQLRAIGAAKVVEYRICHDEYRLPASALAAAAQIATALAPAPTP